MSGVKGFGPPTPTSGVPPLPGIDPTDRAGLTAADILQTQTSEDQLATIHVQMQDQAISTANSIRQMIASTVQGVANQAISASQQFIGDEIAQAKKGLENSAKGV